MKLPILLLATLPALAQTPITLTPATFPASPTSVEQYQPVNFGFSPTATGPNHAWDYRSLVPSGSPYAVPYEPVPAGSVAGAQWVLSRQAIIGRFAFRYQVSQRLSPTGRLSLGRTVPRQARSLAAVTGSPTDSTIINRQTTLLGPNGVVDFPLPLTAGNYARRAFRFATTGTITVQASGLANAPFRIVQRYVFVDSVAGWGTLRLPAAGRPTGTGPVPVLHVRCITLRQDSVYLNGSPAPAPLLSTLRIVQGQTTNAYYDQFWRTGSVQPALEFYYPNSLYLTPSSATYSTEATLLAARPAALPASALQVWPNPAAAGQPVQLTFTGPAGQPLRLQVRDAQGRRVAQGSAPAGQPTALLQALPAGLYLVEAETATGRATQRLLVE